MQIDLVKVCQKFDPSKDGSLFQQDKRRFSLACKMSFSYFDRVEVTNPRIKVAVAGWNEHHSCARVEDQPVDVKGDIRYYNDLEAGSKLSGYSKYSSIALKTTLGISFITASRSFSSLLKLTQYIELYNYLNLQFPFNLKAFLEYFAEDIFGLLFNPFDSVAVSDSKPPENIAE